MKDIVIIDDFLTQEELIHIQDENSYKDKTWILHGSFPQGKEMIEDFHTSFLQKNLMDNEYYTSYLFKKINKTFNYNYKLVDVYLNGHEALRHGSFHTDGNADRTVIFYITPWQPSWGGFTQFMISEIDHTIVPPILGRLVNFRSDILHKGYAFCNQNCPMRITAAFKLKL